MKKSNFECFLYMSVKFKRKHQWTINNTGRKERKHIHLTENSREEKSSEREIQKGILVAYRQGDIPTGGAIFSHEVQYQEETYRKGELTFGQI
jgi:hypothetical protein